MKVIEWILKTLLQPIVKLLNRIFGNHLVQSFISYFSFRLLETSQANQILANTMMYFAILALMLWILEKFFGVKTPLFNISKFFKTFRNSSKLGNPNVFEETFDMTFEETKKIYKKYKLERIGKTMKKILNWIYINKVSISGLLSAILISFDNYYKLGDKLGLPVEWYYILISLLFVIVAWAIKGRGFEKTDLISIIIKVYQDYKQEKKVVKAATKRAKQRLKNAPLIDAIKEEVKKELQPKPPQPPTPHQNQNRVGRL